MSGIITSLPEASVNARATDIAFFSVLAIAGVIFVVLCVLITVFAVRYRRGSPASRGPLPRLLQREIEIGWTVATIFVAIFIFWFFVGADHLPPRASADQLEIHVVARQWMWKVAHPDGAREINALHLPLGQAVRLVMTSEDVIHSFFVPVFRLKQDVLPVRSTELVFTPTKVGTFHLFCAEFCGTQHSHMTGDVVIMTPTDYQAWLHQQPHSDTLAQQGAALFAKLGCGGCHMPGSTKVPSLDGIFGRDVTLADGRRVRVDESYLRRAIVNPGAETVAGFKSIMPSYSALVDAGEVEALVSYIKGLSAGEAHP